MQILLNKYKACFLELIYHTSVYLNHYLSYIKFKLSDNPKNKLHLGCGHTRLNNWINIDTIKAKEVDYRFDIRRRLPFKNSSITHIFSEHVFEHFYPYELIPILQKCHTLLINHGKLDFSIPDFEKITKEFFCKQGEKKALNSFKTDLWRIADHSMLKSDIEYYNHFIYQEGYHVYFYTYAYLKKMLKNIGFKKVNKRTWKRGLDSPFRKQFSLYITALK